MAGPWIPAVPRTAATKWMPVPVGTAPTVVHFKQFDGTSWVARTAVPKVFDGTSWVLHPGKYWSGTSWQYLP